MYKSTISPLSFCILFFLYPNLLDNRNRTQKWDESDFDCLTDSDTKRTKCRTIRAKLLTCTSHASAPPQTARSAPRTSPQSRSTSAMLTHKLAAC